MRQATTSPKTGTVDKDTLVFAIVDVMGYSEDELHSMPFKEMVELASKEVWDYLKA